MPKRFSAACARCRSEERGLVAYGRSFDVGIPGGLEVVVSTSTCGNCGRLTSYASSNREAELAALRAVARSGYVSAKSFRFMRTAMRLRVKELASALSVGVRKVSRWENELADVDPKAWSFLARLAFEHLAGEPEPRTRSVVAVEPPAHLPEGATAKA